MPIRKILFFAFLSAVVNMVGGCAVDLEFGVRPTVPHVPSHTAHGPWPGYAAPAHAGPHAPPPPVVVAPAPVAAPPPVAGGYTIGGAPAAAPQPSPAQVKEMANQKFGQEQGARDEGYRPPTGSPQAPCLPGYRPIKVAQVGGGQLVRCFKPG